MRIMTRRSQTLLAALPAAVCWVISLSAQAPKTEITKWQDGKAAAMAITFDDATINQFRIAVPMLNELGLVGTFFIPTGQIPGSKNMPTFVGRPIMDILRESATVPTNKDNVFERTSLIRYVGEIERFEEAGAFNTANPLRIQSYNPAAVIKAGDFTTIDAALTRLRATGRTYKVGDKPYTPVRSEEQGRPVATEPGGLTWDELRQTAAHGHEMANHSITHAQLPVLDDANILWEAEGARQDLLREMGEQHTFTIEAPYGTADERVRKVLINRFPLTRNWVNDDDAQFMDGIMRGDPKDPTKTAKAYMQWQRGPGPTTPLEEMTGWVDTSLTNGIWLVLVIHGVEGIGSSPIPADRVRAYFENIKAKSDRLWVATYRDQAKYIRERIKGSVTTKQNGQAIEVTATHPLDRKLYDVPLTARTIVPPEWRSVQITQGKETHTVPVQQDATGTFVQYRIMPNAGAAKLERGAARQGRLEPGLKAPVDERH
jgi:peptidoglycan/xylan/chitin deacetylase (PgdA/CDA1 family)